MGLTLIIGVGKLNEKVLNSGLELLKSKFMRAENFLLLNY